MEVAHCNASAPAWTGMVFTLQEKANTIFPLQSVAINATTESSELTAASQLILINYILLRLHPMDTS